ncbi:MAG: hypothetical protein AAGG46_04525, partial [Planctomycetota bacterium]
MTTTTGKRLGGDRIRADSSRRDQPEKGQTAWLAQQNRSPAEAGLLSVGFDSAAGKRSAGAALHGSARRVVV